MLMGQGDISSGGRRRLPLSFRLSFILMLAAVLPLLIIVGISEYSARPILIDQANQTLETDAQTRTELIDTYLNERLLDVETLSQAPGLGTWITETQAQRQALNDFTGQGVLEGGLARDKHYMNWSIFDGKGQLTLSAMPNLPPALPETSSLPDWFQAMKTSPMGQPLVSPVYYDSTVQKAFIDFYAPVHAGPQGSGPFVGFLRGKLNLDYIWGIVHSDRGIANSGSSFILDQDGMFIANTSAQNLFTAVAPLPLQLEQQITAQSWYGTSKGPIVQENTSLANILKSSHPLNHLTLTPFGQTQNYQAAFFKAATLPWTYFVMSPSSVVTQVADQQLLTTVIGAFILLVLAAFIGMLVSRRISRPIIGSVAQLRENSEALEVLAQKQQHVSNDQSWVIDAVQVGLQSVQYYTDAMRLAAHKLGEIGVKLKRGWRQQDVETIRQDLQKVISAAQYIEEAAHYQTDSSQRLTVAIKVTSDVTEQLANGSKSATGAASQLKQVVNKLRRVVGQ